MIHPVDMAAGALDGLVRAKQREVRQAVVETVCRPVDGRMTNCAVVVEIVGYVIRIDDAFKSGLVAAVTLGRSAIETSIYVAIRASDSRM